MITAYTKMVLPLSNVNQAAGISYDFNKIKTYHYISEDEANKRLADLASYESYNYGFD